MAAPAITIKWKVGSDLRPLFARFEPPAQEALLDRVGMNLVKEIKSAARSKGWVRLGNQIAAETNYQRTGDQVEAGTSNTVAGIREHGGIISAPGQGPGSRNAEWLTIPVHPESKNNGKGRWAREIKSRGWTLFRIMGKNGPVLMGTKGKGKRRVTVPMFALRKWVKHPESPWFPPEPVIMKAIDQAVAFGMR